MSPSERGGASAIKLNRERDLDGEKLWVAQTADHGPIVSHPLGRGRWTLCADWRLPLGLWIRQSEWLMRIELHQKTWPSLSAARADLQRALAAEKKPLPSETVAWSAAQREAHDRKRRGERPASERRARRKRVSPSAGGSKAKSKPRAASAAARGSKAKSKPRAAVAKPSARKR